MAGLLLQKESFPPGWDAEQDVFFFVLPKKNYFSTNKPILIHGD